MYTETQRMIIRNFISEDALYLLADEMNGSMDYFRVNFKEVDEPEYYYTEKERIVNRNFLKVLFLFLNAAFDRMRAERAEKLRHYAIRCETVFLTGCGKCIIIPDKK